MFIPLANGCVKTFANIVMILHTYCVKIGYIQVGLKENIQQNENNCDKETLVQSTELFLRNRPKLCTNLRIHPHMISLPLQTFNISLNPQPVQRCCKLHILAEPPKHVPIRADIIFIHGLHGSVVKTWRQGLWTMPVNNFMFQRSSGIYHVPHVKRTQRAKSEERNHLLKYLTADGQTKQMHSKLLHNSFSNESYAHCWPADWLPLDCPGVRVIALDYTTEEYMWRPLWIKPQARTSMRERASEMTELLIAERVGFGHPIIWVGHSKGGLFIKQIIVDAWESQRPAATPFWCATRGIFFYSVPHRGSTLASIRAPLLARSIELQEVSKGILDQYTFKTQKNFKLNIIKADNDYLVELHERFLQLYFLGHLQIEVFTFAETALTLLSMFYLRIVELNSADPGIGEICGIHLDHREICKPRSRNCILYRKLVDMIRKTC